LAKAIAIKPEEEYARSYVDRLILEKLSEMEAASKLGELAEKLSDEGLGLGTIRSLMASNPERFAYHERRWIPAARLAGDGRPFAEVIRIVLDRFGGPMALNLLTQEVARVRRGEPDLLEPIVRRIIETERKFILSANGLVSLENWAFVVTDETFVRGFALNDVTGAEVAELREKLGDIAWRQPGEVERALKQVAPVRLKTFAAVAWTGMSSDDAKSILVFDYRKFHSAVLEVPGYVLGADGVVYPEADARKWVTTAIRLAERLAPTVELDDAAPIEVKSDDIESLVAKILDYDGTTTATRLLEENFEITMGTKTFVDDLANILTSLKADARVQWVGGDRFRKPNAWPEFITEVPEPFLFTKSDVTDAEGELIDVELVDDGLSTSLRKLLSHPLATDVLDEDIQPALKQVPDTIRMVLRSIHRELGTFPMSQIPTGWLDPKPTIQELILIDENGRELQVWANSKARLLYNLIDWWFEQPIESGAVFTLTKTARPNVIEFAWMDQPDPVVYIASQRMEELRAIAAEAETKSTLDILIEVMGHWPKGADFLTLLAEVNVVRRSTRRLIASLLSSYQCFYQRSGSPVWHFDAKKVELGFDKTKRKFVRK